MVNFWKISSINFSKFLGNRFQEHFDLVLDNFSMKFLQTFNVTVFRCLFSTRLTISSTNFSIHAITWFCSLSASTRCARDLNFRNCLDSKIFELWQSNSMWHVSLCSHYLHWVQSDQLDQNDNENWQDCVLHVFCIIASLFEQSFRFPIQLRDRIVIPVPHVAVQGVHVVHGPQILDSKNEKLIYWISRNCEIWIFTRPLKFHI